MNSFFIQTYFLCIENIIKNMIYLGQLKIRIVILLFKNKNKEDEVPKAIKKLRKENKQKEKQESKKKGKKGKRANKTSKKNKANKKIKKVIIIIVIILILLLGVLLGVSSYNWKQITE